MQVAWQHKGKPEGLTSARNSAQPNEARSHAQVKRGAWPHKVYPIIHALLFGICENRAAIAYKSEEGLPDDFIVVNKVAGRRAAFYSGKPHRTEGRYQVTYFSRDRAKLEDKLAEITAAMEEGGFLHAGEGPELEHPATGHFST